MAPEPGSGGRFSWSGTGFLWVLGSRISYIFESGAHFLGSGTIFWGPGQKLGIWVQVDDPGSKVWDPISDSGYRVRDVSRDRDIKLET